VVSERARSAGVAPAQGQEETGNLLAVGTQTRGQLKGPLPEPGGVGLEPGPAGEEARHEDLGRAGALKPVAQACEGVSHAGSGGDDHLQQEANHLWAVAAAGQAEVRQQRHRPPRTWAKEALDAHALFSGGVLVEHEHPAPVAPVRPEAMPVWAVRTGPCPSRAELLELYGIGLGISPKTEYPLSRTE